MSVDAYMPRSPQDWLVDELRTLRAEMLSGFGGIRNEIEALRIELTIIKTERQLEKEAVAKRATWIGLLSAGGFTLIWKAAERWLFGKP